MSNEAGTSNSSSPSFSGSRGADHFDDPNHRVQHLGSSGGHQDVRVVESLSRSLTNPPGRGKSDELVPARQTTDTRAGPSSARNYDPFPTFEQNGTWATPFLQQSLQDLAPDKSQAEEIPYWRPHELSMPTSYPQHPYAMTHSSASFAQTSQSGMEQTPNFGHRNLQGWSASPHPPPPRSMSLVGPEELPTHYQNHYFHDAPDEFHTSTNTSDMHPHTLSSNTSTMSGSDPPLALPGMGSFHEAAPQSMNYVYPPSWSSIPPNQSPHMPDSGAERFTHGWYSDPSTLAQVKEEEAGSRFHRSPHTGYLPHQANPG